MKRHLLKREVRRIAKTVKDYIMLRDKLTEELGEDPTKWYREYQSVCRIKEVVALAYRVTKDKVRELENNIKLENNKKIGECKDE